jgi:hypothetical protein
LVPNDRWAAAARRPPRNIRVKALDYGVLGEMIVLQDAVLHGLGNDSAEWDEVIAHGGLRYGAPINKGVQVRQGKFC